MIRGSNKNIKLVSIFSMQISVFEFPLVQQFDLILFLKVYSTHTQNGYSSLKHA